MEFFMSKAHWLALSSLPGVGGVTCRKLVDRFGTASAVFDASDAELLAVPRINEKSLELLRAIDLAKTEKELNTFSSDGIIVLTWEDGDYPANLRLVNSAPPVLFMQGSLKKEDDQAVAIVGTRTPTSQAVEIATILGNELAAKELTVVSGLAIGIDTAAHQGALHSSGGRTIAVLGSGLKAVHPRSNIPLAEEIIQRGALMTELSPDTGVRGSNLMARDRLISGLSLGVIVVEADENSGSIDTARKALKQRRLLFAVPGSAGTDALLASGVKAIKPDSVDFDWLSQKIKAHIIEADRGRQMSLF
jgi:DNA processing protein